MAPVVAPSLGAAVLLHASWHWVFTVLVVLAGALLLLAALALPETLPPSHRRPLRVRGIAATYLELLRDKRFVILVLVAALGMSGLFAYIAGASFVLQGRFGLDQQVFALVFGAGAVALIGATQFNVVLLKRFAPQTIVLWALVAALSAGGVFVGLSAAHVGGLAGFVVPVWAILARWAWSFPMLLLSRCRGIPTPQALRPRCWAPRSSASAPRWPRWSVCSETTSWLSRSS